MEAIQMTLYNPEDDKLRLQNLYKTYESMVVDEDEEWISLVKQQMVSEGVDLSDIAKGKTFISDI